MTTATEALSELDSPYPLDASQQSAYARDGHVVLRGVVPPETLRPYRDLFLAAVQARSASVKPMSERDTYGKAFLQIMNLWRDDERLRRYVFARRFARIAADLMGVDGVRLYHDQALYKEPGGGFTPWHQDQHYWPLATDKTITLWMPLIDITAGMGTMNFASGSHTEGYLGDMEISDTSEATLAEFVRGKGYDVVNHGAMRAGDATFHSGWTLHGAGPNDSDTLREVMTIIYYADGTQVAPADNKNRQADLDAWIPGGVPGELAASPLNPLLYKR